VRKELMIGLLKGYFQASRLAGHRWLFSACNAIRLTIRCQKEDII